MEIGQEQHSFKVCELPVKRPGRHSHPIAGAKKEVVGNAVHQGSPTGSFILARGKTASAVAALGKRGKENGRLKACLIGSTKIVLMTQAFSLPSDQNLPPRALPWSSMREPVGLDLKMRLIVAGRGSPALVKRSP